MGLDRNLWNTRSLLVFNVWVVPCSKTCWNVWALQWRCNTTTHNRSFVMVSSTTHTLNTQGFHIFQRFAQTPKPIWHGRGTKSLVCLEYIGFNVWRVPFSKSDGTTWLLNGFGTPYQKNNCYCNGSDHPLPEAVEQPTDSTTV